LPEAALYVDELRRNFSHVSAETEIGRQPFRKIGSMHAPDGVRKDWDHLSLAQHTVELPSVAAKF